MADKNSYYYFDADKKVQGPLSLAALQDKWQQGQLSPSTMVAADGGSEWQSLEKTIRMGENSATPRPSFINWLKHCLGIKNAAMRK